MTDADLSPTDPTARDLTAADPAAIDPGPSHRPATAVAPTAPEGDDEGLDERPLATPEALRDRFATFLQRALRRQLWTFFLDADLVEIPMVIPLDGVPVRPARRELDAFLDALVEVAEHVDAHRVVFVLERLGGPQLRSSDECWLDALVQGTRDRELDLHAVLVCSDEGVEVALAPGEGTSGRTPGARGAQLAASSDASR